MVYFGYFGPQPTHKFDNWQKKVELFSCRCVSRFIDEFFTYGLFSEAEHSSTISDSYIDGFCLFRDRSINLYNWENCTFDQLLNCKNKEIDICGSFTVFKRYDKKIMFMNDYYGTHPLYYYCKDEEFYFSNDIVMLLLIDEIPFSINQFACELYCSSWFTVEENNLGENTFFEGIKKMPPASILSFSGGKLNIYGYYNLEKIALLDYNKNEEFSYNVNLLKNALNEVTYAIYESTQCDNIGVSLSGGIDSSVVLGALISCGLRDKTICYHLAFKDPVLHHVSDHEIVKKLMEHTNVQGYIIWGDETLKINNCEIGRDPLVHANGPCCVSNESFSYIVSILMQQNNSTTLLGGDGGDYLFMGTKYCGDYYLKSNKNIFEAIRRAIYLSRSKSFFTGCKNILEHTIIPFIPYIGNYRYLKIFWEEMFGNVRTPEYMGPIIHSLDNKQWEQRFLRFNQSKVLKYWYRRFIYDFMFPKGEYSDTRLNSISIYQPLMDNKIFLQALTVPTNLHYIFTMVAIPTILKEKDF